MSFEAAEHVGCVLVVGDHGLVTSRVLVNEPIGFNSGVKVEVNVNVDVVNVDGDVLFIKNRLRIDFETQAIVEILVIAASFGASCVSFWETNKTFADMKYKKLQFSFHNFVLLYSWTPTLLKIML